MRGAARAALREAARRAGRGGALRIALAGAVLAALLALSLRGGEDRGIEIERRDPPPGVDEIRVHVSGAVLRPQVVAASPGDRVADAIALAGGFAPGADPAALNLARRVADEDAVRVPLLGEAPPLLDVNAASRGELDALPGIGAAWSAAIVEARERGGPYRTTDDLVRRGVIPEGVYERIRDLIAAR